MPLILNTLPYLGKFHYISVHIIIHNEENEGFNSFLKSSLPNTSRVLLSL